MKKNEDIVIVKADKGGACVVMNKADYISKMGSILDDETKFKKLGPVETHDTTVRTEKEFKEYLTSMKTKGLISEMIAKQIRPVGSQRARMYGAPKLHKSEVPLRGGNKRISMLTF